VNGSPSARRRAGRAASGSCLGSRLIRHPLEALAEIASDQRFDRVPDVVAHWARVATRSLNSPRPLIGATRYQQPPTPARNCVGQFSSRNACLMQPIDFRAESVRSLRLALQVKCGPRRRNMPSTGRAYRQLRRQCLTIYPETPVKASRVLRTERCAAVTTLIAFGDARPTTARTRSGGSATSANNRVSCGGRSRSNAAGAFW
jgi:hypothetical protein